MNKKNDRGSALVLVIVSAMFLIILTGALYTYLKSNVDTQIWTRERIQAKLSAEAGVNLATHMLVAGAELPSNLDPQDILGSPTSFEVLPGGMGSVYASVDPSDSNKVVTSANAFLIRCIAQVPGSTVETWGMESIVMPENLARFSVFMNNPSTAGYYGDGYRFDGPFYANGPISIYSSSPTHANDPFFYSLHLTSDYYLYGTGPGGAPASTPEIGNLQMQPFHRLSMGSPYFEMGVDPIPFGPDELNWEGVENAAISGGLVLRASENEIFNGSRLCLRDSTLVIQHVQYGTEDVYDLSVLENPVVWIANAPTDSVFLRGDQTNHFDMALTIGMMGHLYMSGELKYANRDLEDPENRNLLGIISVYGDLVIANDPGPEDGWDGHHIVTDGDFEYDAVLVALQGRLLAENYLFPVDKAEFLLVGGYMIDYEWYTGTATRGFDISVYFDPRLLSMHPPFFPTTANWLTIMWRDRHDMTAEDVEDGLPPY